MTENRLSVVELFGRAFPMDQAQREQFLQELSDSDPQMASELRALLESDAISGLVPRSADTLDASFSDDVLNHVTRASPTIGDYEILDVLGAGGMGVVYRARQKSLARTVALKVIQPGLGLLSEAALQRFRHEASILGRLQHPGIARIYDAGTADTGVGTQPYYAMELIDGKILTEHVGAFDLSLSERLELFVRICDAAHHAHERGIVHRDLKPGNILVANDGTPKIVDFGLAKAPDEEDEAAALTKTGQVLGTLNYMSPEQAFGHRGIDARTDVYSLGVILYELLCGQIPFRRSSQADQLQAIREEEPASPRTVDRTLATDLETICLKALEKEVSRRYSSAHSLGDDVRRFRSNEPIFARPASTFYQARKFAQRNRVLVGATFATMTALLIGVIFTSIFANRAQASAKEADARATEAKAATNLAEQREAEANDELERRRRLSDLTLLKQLQARAEALWPARPHLVEAMEEWLKEVDRLRASLPAHELELARLREKAAVIDEAALLAALASSSRAQEYEDAAELLAILREEMESMRESDDAESIAQYEATAQAASTRLISIREEIEAAARESIRWRFPRDPDTQFQHDNLAVLVKETKSLLDEETGLVASIRERVSRARRIEDETVGEEFDAWIEAMDAIFSSEEYGGWELAQELIGLVPIGPDPDSGLWEFWHVETGARPERDEATGQIRVSEEMGVVFILIPGGTFWMGASNDPSSRNYDPRVSQAEHLVHEITLEPYLISKYELTQGQWFRLTGKRPSYYPPGDEVGGNKILASNPVTSVSWEEFAQVLPRYELSFPTEAQWEHACRASSSSIWWCGDLDSIAGPEGLAGNVFDRGSIEERGAPASWGKFEAWDDGHAAHAPVGSFRANAFGLYDVLGNVFEWCEDPYEELAYTYPASPKDGHRLLAKQAHSQEEVAGAATRVFRGGCFSIDASRGRSATRERGSPSSRSDLTGVRPTYEVSWD